MAKAVDYYFPPASPWAYLGHERLIEIANKTGATINLKPCDLGKVFSVSGGVPLNKRSPQRQAYRLLELKRWSEYLNQPLNLQPKYFPVSGELASLLIIATRIAHGTSGALKLSGAVMRAVWAEERNIADADTLAAIANECGVDGRALLKSAEAAAVQAEYAQNTEDAIAANVFGGPWYVVDGEGYWGQDRLDFVERALSR